MANFKGIRQVLLLFILLVVMPGVSWYYLNGGLSYRQNAKAELRNYGNISKIQLNDLSGKSIQMDSLSVYLIQAKHSPKTDSAFRVILHAYQARNDVMAFDVPCDGKNRTDSTPVVNLVALQSSTQLCDLIDKATLEFGKKTGKSAEVFLVNTKAEIVQAYDLSVSDDRARLVKHVSVLMPNVKRVDKPVRSLVKEK